MTDRENLNEQRLVELESRVAFQDRIIDELNGVVAAQQEQIDGIEKALSALQLHVKTVLSDPGGDDGR
ncbi:MAG: SlyX family protein [Proteobacteria bacterium]|nr:SlyX family protein [Pseudomonadota bacterium]MBU1737457.1 SlyX family protein [Pseudomonadota bacterium]